MLKPGNPDLESRILESFSRHAKSYDRYAHLQKTMAERLATLLPSKFPERITEIGCGTGVFTRHLLAHPVKHLVLNDISSNMLDCLQKNLRLPSGTEILVGNAERMGFKETDLLTANAVFQWFNYPEETINRMALSLSDGGYLVFSTFGPETLKEFREVGSLESPLQLRSFEEWKKVLRAAGLTIEKSEVEVRKSFFPKTHALLRSLQQIGAAPLRMMKPGSLRKILRHYDEKYSTPHGIYASWEILYFSARK